MPVKILSRLVFPDPFGPTRAWTVFFSTEKEKSQKSFLPLKFFSIFFTSIDSSLANLTTISTKMLDSNFTFNTFSLILFMTVSILVLSLVLTYITENVIAKKLPKYEYVDDLEMEFNPSKVELKGLILSIFASIIYLIIIRVNEII